MQSHSILLIRGYEVIELLRGREREIISVIADAYRLHAEGLTSLPKSTFLRFPNNEVNRIIALPAHLGGDTPLAGLKWISSFPLNTSIGLKRASALIIMNSTVTGVPETILEGSVISAMRTAASAALASLVLSNCDTDNVIGIVGCGVINFYTLQFLLSIRPRGASVVLYDVDPERSAQFRKACVSSFSECDISIVAGILDVFPVCSVISIATTQVLPYIQNVNSCRTDSTLLHLSLRDLSPEVIVACDNVVDDIEHVCRAETSVHLAKQKQGNTDFITCTLGDVLQGKSSGRRGLSKPLIFSPFGLGILDLALAAFVCDLASQHGAGIVIPEFSPVTLPPHL